jgi:hypothetical protein
LPEFPQFIVFPIGPNRDVLTQHPHPPTEITQSQPEDFKFSGIIPDRIEFKLIWFPGIPRRVLPHRTNQQPPPSHLGIIPSRDNIRTRPQNQMEMIRKDGKSQQVDAKGCGQSLSLIFNHDFAVIVILAGHRIITQQVAATNHAIHHMHHRNFIRRKHFRSCHPRHHFAPN